MTQATATGTEGRPTPARARIRVDEHGVRILLDLLLAEEARVLSQRRELADREVSTEGHNQLLARIRRVKDEVIRTADELGVYSGQ